MRGHAKFLGHPIHPMLIVFPLGLLATATIFDIIYLFADESELIVFSYWAIAAGIIGGLIAGLFGLWDWLQIPGGTRAKNIGLWHGGGNLVVTGLFIAAWALRTGETGPNYAPEGIPVILEIAGVLLAAVTGWLGGELVDRLGVGVDEGAHPDAPSSLTGRPASESVHSRPSPRGQQGGR